MIDPISHIKHMAPYALADLSLTDHSRIVSMAQNESLRGPSPGAIDAVMSAVNASELYPDPDWLELREAIAKVHRLDPANILCGAGSMELISSIAQAYLGPGRTVLTTQYAYAFIKTVTQASDAEICMVEEPQYRVCVDRLLDAVGADTHVVFVANPGNPTGTRIVSEELERLRDRLDTNILLIIDEAYGEFCDDKDHRLFHLIEGGNTIILRTFSKAYGLAGMRVGWGYFPPCVAGHIRKLLNPNNVSVASQAAATAAMRDQTYMQETCEITSQLRNMFLSTVQHLGIEAVPSDTNFVLLNLKDEAEASHADDWLRSKGIVMRPMGGYGLSNCLRATIVNASDMEFVQAQLSAWRENGSHHEP